MEKKMYIGKFSCVGESISASASYDYRDNIVTISFYNKDGFLSYTYKSVHDVKSNIFEVAPENYNTIIDEIEKELSI